MAYIPWKDLKEGEEQFVREILESIPSSDEYFITDTTWQHPTQLPGDDYKGAPEALQSQVGGDHYKKLKIQPVEYILANNLGYIEGNIIKYITRWKDKGGVQDLEKIKHYCDLLIEGNK